MTFASVLKCSNIRSTLRYSFSTSPHICASRKSKSPLASIQSEFYNPVAEIYGHEYVPTQGIPADNKPVKKYHEYIWCGCGLARTQPFCDHTCKSKYWKKVHRGNGGPVTYIAPESKDVWFCNCKSTAHRPFCDGSHRSEEIQTKKIDGKQELFEPQNL